MERKMIYTLDEFDREERPVEYCEVIEPAFAERNVAMSIVSSDEYAPFAAVVIASIIANSSAEHNYDIVVLTNDMLQRNRWRMQRMQEGHTNVSVRVLDISRMIEGFSFYTWAHFTSNTYYRLLTPDVFSKYEKVVYLDSDIVVNHDIAEFFHTDLTGYYMAAAYDTHVVSYCTRKPPLEQREYNRKVLKMEKPEQYFQAGVSLFNVEKIRADFEPGYLMQQALKSTLRWLDQDLLNMLFYGKIKRMPNRWNVMICNDPNNADEYFLPREQREEYFMARQDPAVIHYVGRAIPCYTTTPDLFEYFWKYARQTEFYEILLQRMAIDYAEKLAESVRIQMRQELHRESVGQKLKRYVRAVADILLPKDSKRRLYVKRILFSLKRWN